MLFFAFVMMCTAQFCAKLSLPGNGTLSTEMVVYGTVVRVSCDRGFIMSDGNLSQSLECVDGNDFIAWNDTVDNCQRNYICHTLYLLTYLLTYSPAMGHWGTCPSTNSNSNYPWRDTKFNEAFSFFYVR